jgi:hypothetical protein
MNTSVAKLTPGSRLLRPIGTVVTALAMVLAFVAPSAAATPERLPIDFTHVSTDSEVCASIGVTIDVVEHGYGFIEIFTDAAGAITSAVLHLTVDYTMTANGITIRQRDRKERIISDAGVREMGEGSIHAPNGLYQVGGGGQVILLPDGTEIVHGRPPELDVNAFCRVFLGPN